MFRVLLAGVVALTIAASAANASGSLTTGEKIMLQATMQQTIDRHLVDGQYFYLDRTTALVIALFPAKAHPMILQMGEHFVLCTDFRDSEGISVNVDFYVARRGEAFVIFDTIVDDRAPLDRLMREGLARPAG